MREDVKEGGAYRGRERGTYMPAAPRCSAASLVGNELWAKSVTTRRIIEADEELNGDVARMATWTNALQSSFSSSCPNEVCQGVGQ